MTTNTGGVRRDHGETEEVQQYRDYFASEVFSTITTCGALLKSLKIYMFVV